MSKPSTQDDSSALQFQTIDNPLTLSPNINQSQQISTQIPPPILDGQLIELETWDRRDHYNFFQTFLKNWVDICSEVECGNAKADAKAKGHSFFIRSLYAVLRASNEIMEFRYRVDKFNRIVLYDTIDAISPIKSNLPGATYVTTRFNYMSSFDAFALNAAHAIKNVDHASDPFADQKEILEKGKHDVLLLSCIPNLYFTSMGNLYSAPPKQNNQFPVATIGKVVKREGEDIMPVNIFFAHHFVDGMHVGSWIEKISKYLQNPYADAQ